MSDLGREGALPPSVDVAEGRLRHGQRHGNRTEKEFPLHMNVYHSVSLIPH